MFKVGDLILGLPAASPQYSITGANTQWVVYKVENDKECWLGPEDYQLFFHCQQSNFKWTLMSCAKYEIYKVECKYFKYLRSANFFTNKAAASLLKR